MEELLKKIHSTGYWRVNIRPTEYEPTRIPSLSKCKEIIRATKVSLRGWDYPHIDKEGIAAGQTWVESGSDWMMHIEYWRFYQSAQFVHHFAFWEDYEYKSDHRLLSMLSSLYSLTEIYEFAMRLAQNDLLGPAAEIRIDLSDMAGRSIFEPSRVFSRLPTATVDKISLKKVLAQEALVAQGHEFALEATIELFERFNWENPPRQILEEDQRKFLERR